MTHREGVIGPEAVRGGSPESGERWPAASPRTGAAKGSRSAGPCTGAFSLIRPEADAKGSRSVAHVSPQRPPLGAPALYCPIHRNSKPRARSCSHSEGGLVAPHGPHQGRVGRQPHPDISREQCHRLARCGGEEEGCRGRRTQYPGDRVSHPP